MSWLFAQLNMVALYAPFQCHLPVITLAAHRPLCHGRSQQNLPSVTTGWPAISTLSPFQLHFVCMYTGTHDYACTQNVYMRLCMYKNAAIFRLHCNLTVNNANYSSIRNYSLQTNINKLTYNTTNFYNYNNCAEERSLKIS